MSIESLAPPLPTAVDTTAGRTAPDTDGVDYALVDDLRGRVSTRLAGEERQLGPEARRELTRQLIRDEYGLWLLQEAGRGRAAPDAAAENLVFAAVLAELDGLGRIAPLVGRDDVEDVHFEGCDPTVLRLCDGSFEDGPPIATSDEELIRVLRGIGARSGDGQSAREFSAAHPILNVRLRGVGPLGARLQAAMDVLPRPAGVIRVHRLPDPSLEDLRRLGMIDTPMREFLTHAVDAGASILVSGNPGVGKTTVLRSLGNSVGFDNVMVTVEDERELGFHLPRRDPVTGVLSRRFAVVRAFESRLANAEGRGGFGLGDALHEALRASPTWLCLGEVRGGYVMALLDAVTSGVSSVMCTIHSPTAEGLFDKVLVAALKADPTPAPELVMRSLAALDLVVHVSRDRHYRRYVSGIYELGHVGDRAVPDFVPLFTTPPGGVRPVPAGPGRPSADLADRLVAAGFDDTWLDPVRSDWLMPEPGVLR